MDGLVLSKAQPGYTRRLPARSVIAIRAPLPPTLFQVMIQGAVVTVASFVLLTLIRAISATSADTSVAATVITPRSGVPGAGSSVAVGGVVSRCTPVDASATLPAVS